MAGSSACSALAASRPSRFRRPPGGRGGEGRARGDRGRQGAAAGQDASRRLPRSTSRSSAPAPTRSPSYRSTARPSISSTRTRRAPSGRRITKVDVDRIDAGTDVRVAKKHLDRLDLSRMPLVVHGVVEAHEAGLLFVDGQLTERLPAGPACLLGGGPDGADPEGRHASDAARGDGAGDPDQGSRRHPRDADGVHAGDRSGEGGAGVGRRRQHGLPARAVRDPRGGGDAHAGRDPGGARHDRPRGARRS